MKQNSKKTVKYFSQAKYWRKFLTFALIILFLSLPAFVTVQAAGGDLDLSFGVNGTVLTHFANTRNGPSDAVLQPDGKIIVAGNADDTFVVVRYDTNGNLDQSFGNGGKAFGNVTSAAGNAIALQPDGKIIVAGNISGDFGLMRFNTDGSLDNGFGTNGLVVTDMLSNDEATDVALQNDGKIVVVGEAGLAGKYGFARYDTNGSLDQSFGNGGKVVLELFSTNDHATALALQADGKIVAVGAGSIGFQISRLNSNGSLDNTFDGDGKTQIEFSGRGAGAEEVVIQPDGKILAGGGSNGPNGIDFSMVRLQVNGTPDSSFGNDGRVITPVTGVAYDQISSLALQPDGKILAGGYVQAPSFTFADFALVRYHTDGSVDSTFGNNGIVTAHFFDNHSAIIKSVMVQNDGKIVVAGSSIPRQGQPEGYFALARYEGDNFDICIEDEKNGNLLQVNSFTGAYAFRNCKKGISLTGTATVTKTSCKITLSNATLSALVNSCTRKGNASVQEPSSGKLLSITDNDITNNSCRCN
jgi:uncharacterized delta-60 repeat protein